MNRPDPLARTAALLADPHTGAEISPDEVVNQADRLIPFLRHQKVPLLGLSEDSSAAHRALMATPAFQAAYAEEQTTHSRLREEFALVATAWAGEGIGNLQVKSVGMTPSFPYRSDNLDVLVQLAHGPRAAEVLLDLGYVELKNVEEPHKFLFRKFHLGREISAIHLHECVGWGTSFLDESLVWEYARMAQDDPLVVCPSPEDGLLITLAHAFYENKIVSLSDVQKARHCLRHANLDWDRLIRVSERKGWRDGLAACLLIWSHIEQSLYGHSLLPAPIRHQADRWLNIGQRQQIGRLVGRQSFPFRIPFLVSKQFYYRKVWRDRTIGPRRKVWDALLHTTAGIRRNIGVDSHPAMLVTLSGLDGAGKSAHAETLSAAFSGCHIENGVVWSRGGSSPLTDAALHLVRQGHSTSNEAPPAQEDPAKKVARRQAALRSPIARQGWLALVGADLLRMYAVHIWWPMRRGGRVIICDRYLYDALVEIAAYANDPDLLHGWLARLLVTLAPKPQIRYLLDVSAETAARRSATPEDRAFLATQKRLYRNAASLWNLQVVSNEGEFTAITDELVRTTLRRYYRDYWTLLNAIFLFNPRREKLAQHRQEVLSQQGATSPSKP
ncbi:MAG: hypothetical protein GXP41_01740 [Chloroflexi bacterium]|nr:hypothetical protein [Chloroflexota bacterium]